MMKRILPMLLILTQLASCTMPAGISRDDSGTFRGRWYSYYHRGLDYAEKGDPERAAADLKKSLSVRQEDQRMARTYGMHFIDYFGHRELGIVYLNEGRIDEAIRELEESISQEESAKAFYYLNKAREKDLRMKKIMPSPPIIFLLTPEEGAAVKSFMVRVKGNVSGKGFVSKIYINDRPYRFDLAKENVEFEMDVSVDEETDRIEIISEDLLGNTSRKSVHLTVDREGPTIDIFDILAEEREGEKLARIKGEVNDSTGISRLFINDKVMNIDNSKTYELDLLVNIRTLSGKFVIKAFDSLNNGTTAELDVEKELMVFNEKPVPVLLALKGEGVFSMDDTPPVITLRDSADISDVFVDKYYVEGEVSDNKKVEEIMVNGRELLTKKGRKIFFSRIVKLDEGRNEIDVEAYDFSGNRAESGFIVTRKIPEVLQVGSRMSISILPFDTKDRGTVTELLAYEHLTGSFVEQKRFRVIERAKLEQILIEQQITREKLTDPKYSIKAGRLMAADTILATTFVEGPKSVEFTSRVINTETSEVMEVKDVYSEDTGSASIKQLMDGLASKVAGSFPLVEGIVIEKDRRYVYTDIGGGTGIKRDMGIIVYRMGREIKHPTTGKSLGRDTENLGRGNIEEVHEDFSKVKMRSRSGYDNIELRDLAITK